MRGFQLRRPFVGAVDADDEAADEILAAALRRDVVGQRFVRLAGLLLDLLAQGVEAGLLGSTMFVVPDHDVVAVGIRREEAVDAAGGEALLGDDPFQQLKRLDVELGGFLGAFLVFGLQDAGLAVPDAAEFPGVEEGRPVDVFGEFAQRLAGDHAGAGEFGDRRGVARPVGQAGLGAGFDDADDLFLRAAGEGFAGLAVLLVVVGDEGFLLVGGEQGGGDGDRARGVEHVDHRAGVVLGDLDRGVGGGGRRAADQQRHGEAGFLHLLGDVDHLVERGRDEAGQADHVGAEFLGFREDFVAGNHHTHVGDFEAVAGEHHADDVLADVVDVALHRGDQEAAGGAAAAGEGDGFVMGEFGIFGEDPGDVAGEELGLLGFHEGRQPGDGLLHHAGGFHHLGQEHLAGAEEVADHAHAVHQRAFDHLERAAVFQAGFLGVLVDELVDALEQRVFEPLLDRLLAPGEVFLDLLAADALEALGELEHPLGGVGAAVEKDVFHVLEHFLRDLVVDLEHPGVDDAHVHPGAGRVVEEGGVHRLADDVVAAEGERDVGDSAGDLGVGQVGLDPAGRVDEIEGVVVVLLDAGGDGQDVGVEDDVLRREADLVDQYPVGAFADPDFLVVGRGLAVLVEGHDHDGGAVAADVAGLLDELLLAFLERDRVHDALALEVFQAFGDDLPLRGVDHDRDLRDGRLALHELEEAGHHRLAVDQPVVEADVDHVGAALDLLAGDFEGLVEFPLADQLGELRRAGDIGALADHQEILVRRVVVGFGAGETEDAG